MKTIIFPKEDNGYAYRMRTPLIKDDQNDDADYLQLAKKANIQVLEHYMAKDDCTIKVYNDDDTCDTYNAKAGDLIITFPNNKGIKHRVTVLSNADVKENIEGVIAEKEKEEEKRKEAKNNANECDQDIPCSPCCPCI